MALARIVSLAILACAAQGTEWVFQTDQPDLWYNPSASHHGKHALGGAALGVAAYTVAGLGTRDRPWRYGAALATGAAVGYAYELAQGRHGTSYVDPVDAAWVAAGSLAGAALADLTEGLVTVVPRPDGAALAVAWHW